MLLALVGGCNAFGGPPPPPPPTTRRPTTEYPTAAPTPMPIYEGPPVIATDAFKNLHLNTSGQVLVNGNHLQQYVELIEDMKNEVTRLRSRLRKHRYTRAPTVSPSTPSPTVSPSFTHAPSTTSPTVSPTAPTASPVPTPTRAPQEVGPFYVMYDGTAYNVREQSFTIMGGDREVKTIVVNGNITLEIEAAGAAGGRGMWSTYNDTGAPGGTITVQKTFSFSEPTSLYAFVSEMGVSHEKAGGAGGGSTDLRTLYEGSFTNVSDLAFLNDFADAASLNSRIVVGGGGGGAHGSPTYGYWGDDNNSPGAGGPNRNFTDSISTRDIGHTDTGATTTGPGIDGGSSVDARFTGDGEFGVGGNPSDGEVDGVYVTAGDGSNRLTHYTGMTWPNGGSGTGFANGGGGGGWYGGACNWPNGGGGSNYAQDADVIANEGATNAGAGYLKITIVEI